MKLVLTVSAFALAWYFIGMILVGVINFFDGGSKNYTNWEGWKHRYYLMSSYGPLIIIFVAIFGLIELGKYLGFKKRLALVVIIGNWIVAGFRNPPTKPKESTLDLPTVSP